MKQSTSKPARQYFSEGFNCCQSVLTNFAVTLGLDNQLALKIASNFGGGMKEAETCGAVTGALMVIGLKYGHSEAEDLQAKEKSTNLAREFKDRFRAKHGSLLCKKLLNYDLTTEEGRNIIMEKDLFNTLCPEYVNDAEAILHEIL